MEQRPTILHFKDKHPKIAADAFVAPTAAVIGDVVIDAEASIWYSCAIRGDVHEIRIGPRSNVQDGTVIHGVYGEYGSYIGSGCTIGHACVIHGCTIGDNCLIGMGATVMEGAVIEDGAWVAAGALVTPGKHIGKGELWIGSPAKLLRTLKPEETEQIAWNANHYCELAEEHIKSLKGS